MHDQLKFYLLIPFVFIFVSKEEKEIHEELKLTELQNITRYAKIIFILVYYSGICFRERD